MAEYVGFITNMKPEWMDLAYGCRLKGLTKEEAKPIFEEAASSAYSAKENLLKTRRVLETIFYDNDSWILESSLQDYRTLTVEQRLPLYWALLISTFPIFFDTCRSIGTIAEYRDTVTTTQARAPVYEQWGARNIIHQSVKKVIQTLKDFGALLPCGSPGVFNISRHSISDSKLVCYLAVAVITASPKEYLTWEAIANHRALFPYEIEHVTQADLAACEKLCLERMGDEVVIRIR